MYFLLKCLYQARQVSSHVYIVCRRIDFDSVSTIFGSLFRSSSDGLVFFFLCPLDEDSRGILIYPCSSVRPFVRPDIDTMYMVCWAISSYSFGATALIFCMMYTHNGGVHVHRILIFIKYLIMTGSWT